MKHNASGQSRGAAAFWLPALAAAVLCTSGAGCTDSSSGARAEFGRPKTLALNGQTLFSGAATDPRMRMYNLKNHKVIRAPNPIFSLSIPTIARPHTIASYRSPDGQVSSPFVIALSSARSIMAVASVERRNLAGYAVVPGIPLSASVLAMESPEDDTIAVVAAMTDGVMKLYKVRIPAEYAHKAIDPSMLGFEEMKGVDLTGVIPQTMLASPTDPNLLAIADRAAPEKGILLLDVSSQTVTPVSTGAPILDMAFDITGKKLFALIDSDACVMMKNAQKAAQSSSSASQNGSDAADSPSAATSPEGQSGQAGTAAHANSKGYYNNISYEDRITAGSEGSRSGLGLGDCTGLIAVDAENGTLLKDAPLKVPGILRTLGVLSASELKMPAGGTKTIDPLILVGSSEGTIYPVDGSSLTMIKAESSKYSVTMTHVDANARLAYIEEDIADLAVNPMRSVDETITILYEGRLPDFRGRTGLMTTQGIMSTGTDFASLGVKTGDKIQITGAADACKEFTVSAVEKGMLSVEGGADESCTGQVIYSVRAAGQYLVSGTVTGYMGRVSDGEAFSFDGPPPYEFGEDEVSEDPALSFTMTVQDHTVGGGWKVVIKHCVEPYNIPISSVTFPTDLTCDFASGECYAAYQGGNALIRIVPNKLVHDSVSTSNGLSLYR